MGIWEKDKNDFDGLEDYVYSSLSTGSIEWFPINQATVMMAHQGEMGGKSSEVNNMQTTISQTWTQLKHLEKDISILRTTLLTNTNEISAFKNEVIEVKESISAVVERGQVSS